MKESILYQKLPDGQKVRCDTCNHRCIIELGHKGICGVRKNIEGTLYALNYERTISVSIDPIEKKPLYHFMPGTTTYSLATIGCNLSCSWCQNWQISQLQNDKRFDEELPGDKISPEEHVMKALELGCPSISYTYTEPTIFLEYALDIMKIANANGLKNIWVTNGYMTKETLELIAPYLDAANIDLKAWNNDIYKKYCGSNVQPILDNIQYLNKLGIHQEITTLVIPEVNDDQEQLTKIANFIAGVSTDIPWHLSRFFPGWKMGDTPKTPIITLEMAEEIGKKANIKNIHLGNI
ncbi:MAG: pyruvate formate lyase activating enzyme [Fusobacteria bacterium]|nr:MAG: pyruvate formate lyase activating enzyme [Fusobacteriota bacterium]KAF0228743.1 MAG: pyruvate formate lyase activating [Fusobacteriota bacterium]